VCENFSYYKFIFNDLNLS